MPNYSEVAIPNITVRQCKSGR